MRLIIAGSRSIPPHIAHQAIEWGMEVFDLSPTLVISGTAQGVDKAGEKWARNAGVPVHRYPADWDAYGKVAGVLRNRQMAQHADAVLLVWDGRSRGSANMKQTAEHMNLAVYELVLDPTANDFPVTYSYAGPADLKPTTRRIVLAS